MKERGEAPLWPPNPAPHMTEWLIEIGPTTAGTMGEAPISWQDLTEWQRNVGIVLDAWEARVIRRMSEAFLSQRHESEKPSCIAPFLGDAEAVAVTRANVAQRVKALFSGLQKKD